MEDIIKLVVLVGKLIWAKASSEYLTIKELIETAFQNFWFQFAWTLLVISAVIAAIEFLIRYYYFHNFIHRKIKNDLSSSYELKLFMESLLKKEKSKGMLMNLKYVRSQLLSLRTGELRLLETELVALKQSVRSLKTIASAAAIFLGLLSSFILGIFRIDDFMLTQESVVKTLLFMVSWFLISHVVLIKHQRRIVQMHELVQNCIDDKRLDSYFFSDDHEKVSAEEAAVMKEH
ncbi:hypothetical protein WD019_12615 [Fictibacillus sp. Mic-4]|uniref:hypothetical protein n=1 Tax=Fictibacillus TaxID=1329200 RepID=UPI00041DE03F|nr:hypothetical protein [Fictibacillus gelatini]